MTDRKNAESAKDCRPRLSSLLEIAPSVIYSFKAKNDYAPTFVSENIKRLLGYCPEKYLEHADFWRSNVHPEDLASVEAEQSKLFEKGRHVAEYRFRKKNGTYIWVSDDQYLLRGNDGEPDEIVGSWSNITTRKQAERAENAARARFDLLLHWAPAVVYSFEAGGSYAPTFVSENIKRVLGYEPDQYLKDPDFWRAHVHPEDLPEVEAGAAKLFEEGQYVAEYRFRKADSIYCWVSDEQHLVKDQNSHPLEVIGSWSEVTARKTAEQAALAQSEQQLTDAIETIWEGFCPARFAKAGQGCGRGGFGGDCRKAQSIRRRDRLNALQEPDPAIEREQGQEDYSRPQHVADEARHLDRVLLANRPHHEIGGVADIGQGAHEHGP